MSIVVELRERSEDALHQLAVDGSSIVSVADRREMPSDCRCERSAKWSIYFPAAISRRFSDVN